MKNQLLSKSFSGKVIALLFCMTVPMITWAMDPGGSFANVSDFAVQQTPKLDGVQLCIYEGQNQDVEVCAAPGQKSQPIAFSSSDITEVGRKQFYLRVQGLGKGYGTMKTGSGCTQYPSGASIWQIASIVPKTTGSWLFTAAVSQIDSSSGGFTATISNCKLTQSG